jgi:hypothetical protein
VFGSAPLQLGLDASFVSADVDIFSNEDLREAIEEAGLAEGQREIYVQQSDELVFSASLTWQERAYKTAIGNVTVILPHPIDILVSKLPRLEPKDLRAFLLVIEKTGHPTPDELITALQRHVDLFRPNFDEENSGDPIANTQRLWHELYGESINVRRDIIAPALQRRKAGYGTPPNLRNELRSMA